MTRHLLTMVTVLAVALPAVRLLGQAGDPVVGTWVLNISKSKFSPGPAPKSETRTYVVAGQDIKASSKGVDAAGKPTAGTWTVNTDGKDRPMTGDPDADSLAVTRVDAFTVESIEKKAGKIVITARRVISRDGKLMTITFKGTNAKGQPLNDVMVFDKQ